MAGPYLGKLPKPYLPAEIDDATLVFPANVVDLMMPMDDIPEAFQEFRGTEWNELASAWFFTGLKDTKTVPKKGINPEKAWAHLATISRSYQPAHEHKEACVAYLMSLWFESVTYTSGSKTHTACEAVEEALRDA